MVKESTDIFGTQNERISKLAETSSSTLWLISPVGDSMGTTMVLKELAEPLRANNSAVEAMYIEGQIGRFLDHPNLCKVRPAVRVKGTYFLPMEFVHGETLRTLTMHALRQNVQPRVGVIASIGAQIARGLAHAHQAVDSKGRPLQLIHRDISGANIMVGFDGVAKLIDFGVAQCTLGDKFRDEGQLRGKFSYMSPEQVLGLPVTQASDIFSLGTTLWEHLTCRPLFRASSPIETALRVASHAAVPPSSLRESIPPALDELVLACLSAEPDARPTAAEVALRLDTIAQELVGGLAEQQVANFARSFGIERMRWFDEQRRAQQTPPRAFPRREKTQTSSLEQIPPFRQAQTSEHAALDPLKNQRFVGVSEGLRPMHTDDHLATPPPLRRASPPSKVFASRVALFAIPLAEMTHRLLTFI